MLDPDSMHYRSQNTRCIEYPAYATRQTTTRPSLMHVTFQIYVLLFIPASNRYKKKYLQRSVSRLEQFGLKKNEAYDLLVPDKAWEMDRQNLEINRKLGEGAFGTVYGADYFSKSAANTCIPVAVKTLHDGADLEEKVILGYRQWTESPFFYVLAMH